jgi:hypothetical protein
VAARCLQYDVGNRVGNLTVDSCKSSLHRILAGEIGFEDEAKVPASRNELKERRHGGIDPICVVIGGGQSPLEDLNEPLAALVEEGKVEIEF